jgi:hypothetical protein
MALMNINTQLIKIDKEVEEEYLFYERKKTPDRVFLQKLNLLLIKLQSKKFILIVKWQSCHKCMSMLLTPTLISLILRKQNAGHMIFLTRNKYLILFLHFKEALKCRHFFIFGSTLKAQNF